MNFTNRAAAVTLCLALQATATISIAATSLSIGEINLASGNQGALPVELRTDAYVAALQMDVLFDSTAYTVLTAGGGMQADTFRVDSRVVEPGRMRVVVGAPNNAPLQNGVIFTVPLTAKDQFASFYPVVLTNFALSTANGTPVVAKIAPRVRLLHLTSGGKVNGHDGVELMVEAGATDGSISKVEYYVAGVKIGESTSGNFAISWSPVGSGPFVVKAIAYDSNGLATESREIPVVITNVGTEAVKATYAGRVIALPFNVTTSGLIKFVTTSKGGFSVQLQLGAKRFSKSGTFAEDGTAVVQFSTGRSTAPITLRLQQYATNLVDQIAGELSDGTLTGDIFHGGSFVADFTADRSVWSKGVREPVQKGAYTIVLPAGPDAAALEAPLGDSVGALIVSQTGSVKGALKLADGTNATVGGFLSKDGLWPLVVSLYKGKGTLTGDLQFADVGGISDFAGDLEWLRPGNSRSKTFKDGFTTAIQAVGSLFEAPDRGERVAGVSDVAGNVHLIAMDGGLSETFSKDLTLNLQNKFAVTSVGTDRLSLKLVAKTGLISGTFVHSDTGIKVKLQGAVLQKQHLGSGYFTSGSFGGGFMLQPGPLSP